MSTPYSAAYQDAQSPGDTMGFVSYHCHSTWSDGKADIAAMVRAAAAAGVAEIGISDHLVLTPYANSTAREWSMPANGRQFDDALADLRRAASAAPLPVRLGVEADYLPETWTATRDLLADLDLDFVIGSVHYADGFPVDGAAVHWATLAPTEVDTVHRVYWERIRELAACGVFDIVGHLDLPKKFGFLPRIDLSEPIAAALDAIAAADLAIELNTSGWDKDCADAYPSLGLLREARRRGIPVLLSADAHCPGEILRHYAAGADRLRAAGYEEMLTFAGRRRRSVPIP